jgi:hypothetical protein
MGVRGAVFFSWSKGEKQRSSRAANGRDSFGVFFCLLSLLSKSNAYFEDLRDLADKHFLKDCTFVACDIPSASAEVSILPRIRDRVSPQFALRTIFGDVEESLPEEVKGAFGEMSDLQLTGRFLWVA